MFTKLTTKFFFMATWVLPSVPLKRQQMATRDVNNDKLVIANFYVYQSLEFDLLYQSSIFLVVTISSVFKDINNMFFWRYNSMRFTSKIVSKDKT